MLSARVLSSETLFLSCSIYHLIEIKMIMVTSYLFTLCLRLWRQRNVIEQYGVFCLGNLQVCGTFPYIAITLISFIFSKTKLIKRDWVNKFTLIFDWPKILWEGENRCSLGFPPPWLRPGKIKKVQPCLIWFQAINVYVVLEANYVSKKNILASLS